MSDILKEGSKKLGIELSDSQIDMLIKYKELLVEWNEKINLTAITDDFGVYTKHFLDSLTTLLTDKVQGDVIDVGTGAGFPGLVLKIAKPEINLTLLDSLNKRINFLKEVANVLEFQNAEFIHSRAEDAGQNKNMRGKFDYAVSRAVAPLNILSEYALPLLKIGGYFIAFKAFEIEDEINEAKSMIGNLGGKIKEINEVKIPFSDITRKIVVIEKIKETPKQFPRKPNKIKKG